MKSLSRRALADLVGCAALFALVALLVWAISPGERLTQRVYLFIPIYLVLVLGGYIAWFQIERDVREPRWLLQALGSIALGAALFIVCVLYGLYGDSSLSMFAAAQSTGIMIGMTEIVCPGYTFIALSGWVRCLVLRRDSKAGCSA